MTRLLLQTLLLLALLTGCAGQSAPAVPSPPPPKPIPTESKAPAPTAPKVEPNKPAAIPGDTAQLQSTTSQLRHFEAVLTVVDHPVSGDKTEYLDQLLKQRAQPRSNQLVLVLFAKDGWDIRFALGGEFSQRGVTVAEVLDLVRSQYFVGVRNGDPAAGAAAFLQALDQKMAQ
jgi:hypothetical protein